MIDANEKYPKVSIITVVFNGAKTLEQTILSVLNQTYKNIEYIIIDGGSTDGTIDVIKKYEDSIAHWISEPDKGIYDAMNKGIKASTGEIIGIINSDDWYELNAINSMTQFLLVNSSFDAVCGDIVVHARFSGEYCKKKFISDTSVTALLRSMTIQHPSVFVKKSFYFKYGLFDTSFKIIADYDLMLKATLQGARIKYLPLSITNFRLGGLSSNQWKTKMEIIKIRKKYNVAFIYRNFLLFIDICQICYGFLMNLFPSEIQLYIKKKREWEKVRDDK